MAAVMVACRPMRTETHATALSAVAVSWLAASAAQGTALLLAAIGQGVGALAGGCGWIGFSTPLDRQVWALVNQPVLNFSSLPGAGGYWLGSYALPIVVALFLLTLRPKNPTLVGQLLLVQAAWWAILIAGAWLPLIDPDDGHLARWLLLRGLAPTLIWLAPATAAAMAAFTSYRLLELARRSRSDLGRTARVATVLVHLILPVLGWLGVVRLVGGALPWQPVLGLTAPVAAVAVFAWLWYPAPYPRPLQGPTPRAVAALAAAVVLAACTIWLAGRPLAEGRVSGVLWGAPESFNNIRPWIEPWLPADLGHEDD